MGTKKAFKCINCGEFFSTKAAFRIHAEREYMRETFVDKEVLK